jgi:hypothetical protein
MSRTQLDESIDAVESFTITEFKKRAREVIDLSSGQSPQPVQLLHFRDGKILIQVSSMLNWVKPIAAVAMSLAK